MVVIRRAAVAQRWRGALEGETGRRRGARCRLGPNVVVALPISLLGQCATIPSRQPSRAPQPAPGRYPADSRVVRLWHKGSPLRPCPCPVQHTRTVSARRPAAVEVGWRGLLSCFCVACRSLLLPSATTTTPSASDLYDRRRAPARFHRRLCHPPPTPTNVRRASTASAIFCGLLFHAV